MSSSTDSAAAHRMAPGARLYARHRADVLLVVVVLLMAVPIVQYMMAQQASRYAFTAALWDQQTVVLDDYEHILGVDRAVRDGHTYSDKAPGQPFFAVPAYGLYRALGGQPATVNDEIGNLGLWATSVWSSAIPAAALAVLMRRLALRVTGPRAAAAAAVGLSLGTLLLPFSTLLFGHVLGSLLSLAAFALVLSPGASRRRLVLGGLVTGCAVLTEFTTAIVAVVLVAFVAWRHGREVSWFITGGIPLALVLMAYNTAVFGGPFSFSYESSATFGEAHSQGLVGVQAPDPLMALRVTIGERGLFTLTPVVLAGVLGSIGLTRHGRDDGRALGIVGLVLFGLFVLLQSGWVSPFGGASPGPRYVTPSLAFLAPGVAYAFGRAPAATAAAAAFGIVTMATATLTLPLAQPTETFAFGHWILRLAEGRSITTVLTMLFGSRLWVFVPPLIAIAVAARLVLEPRARLDGAGGGVRGGDPQRWSRRTDGT